MIGRPIAGGALSLEIADPLLARRGWLWRADRDETIEALAFAPGALAPPPGPVHEAERRWLKALAPGPVHEETVGRKTPKPWLAFVGPSDFDADTKAELKRVARFASAPLAAIAARTLAVASLETYLGRRSAEQALAAPLRRVPGQTLQAALLVADLRGFTELSESEPPARVIAALDAWFDRIAGAVHAFGGEVLKFVGDGVLAIFPVGEGGAPAACEAALRAVGAARAGMARLNEERGKRGERPLAFGAALHFGEMLWGNVGAANRLDFTAIGPAVNLVSRLEGLCKPLGRTALASGAFASPDRRAADRTRRP